MCHLSNDCKFSDDVKFEGRATYSFDKVPAIKYLLFSVVLPCTLKYLSETWTLLINVSDLCCWFFLTFRFFIKSRSPIFHNSNNLLLPFKLKGQKHIISHQAHSQHIYLQVWSTSYLQDCTPFIFWWPFIEIIGVTNAEDGHNSCRLCAAAVTEPCHHSCSPLSSLGWI